MWFSLSIFAYYYYYLYLLQVLISEVTTAYFVVHLGQLLSLIHISNYNPSIYIFSIYIIILVFSIIFYRDLYIFSTI